MDASCPNLGQALYNPAGMKRLVVVVAVAVAYIGKRS
jgi:hypothetical protein